MRLSVSGRSLVRAPRDIVWARVIDPAFVARSAPGVEAVEPAGPDRFRVTTGFGIGALRFTLAVVVEVEDLQAPDRATIRVHGESHGSQVDLRTVVRLSDAGAGTTGLDWAADGEVAGALALVGGGVLESVVSRITERFWQDFAHRAADAA